MPSRPFRNDAECAHVWRLYEQMWPSDFWEVRCEVCGAMDVEWVHPDEVGERQKLGELLRPLTPEEYDAAPVPSRDQIRAALRRGQEDLRAALTGWSPVKEE